MQMKNSKKIYVFILVIVLISSIFINIVQAVSDTPPDPGSDSDPIVSKSYVDSSISGITAQIQQFQLLQDKYNQLLINFDALKKQVETGSSKGYEFIPIEIGQKLFAGMGTEIILVSGKANSIKGTNGGLIDTGLGKQLSNVTAITTNHLLISAANDGRGVFTVSKCFFLIKGTYSLDTAPTDIPVETPDQTPDKTQDQVPDKTIDQVPDKTPQKTPATTESFVGTGLINASSLRIREKADINSKIITSLIKGQKVSIITISGEWYKIKTPDGLIGWTLGKYITKSK